MLLSIGRVKSTTACISVEPASAPTPALSRTCSTRSSKRRTSLLSTCFAPCFRRGAHRTRHVRELQLTDSKAVIVYDRNLSYTCQPPRAKRGKDFSAHEANGFRYRFASFNGRL